MSSAATLRMRDDEYVGLACVTEQQTRDEWRLQKRNTVRIAGAHVSRWPFLLRTRDKVSCKNVSCARPNAPR